MAHDFGTGVSRVLEAAQTNMVQVIWQQGKPPLDSELNFLQQLAEDWRKVGTLRGCPSGVLSNAVNTEEDFLTSPTWSNWFRMGQQKAGENRAILWACVNGWLVPVTGTGTGTPPGSPNDSDTWNKVKLGPPPSNSGDSRIDFVFLEVWLARVPPNPSTANKPSSSALYRYGNVEGGYTYLSDDIQDPAIGFETTQRVQLQYRIRVVSGLVGLTSYPDGFDPTVVKAQGAASAATSYTFENMRQDLGDPGLWRAGDGTANSLGTVDGYTYAIPLCAVFRRNSVAWDGDPGQNLNGGFNRNPTAVDRTGATTFSTTPTLAGSITDTDTSLSLASIANIPLPLSPASGVYIQIDDEILQYSVITGTTMTVTRGHLGTKAEAHTSGATITVLSGRPDGLFSDQVAKTDILDLRHAVNPNGFDYQTLLRSNLDKLLRGEMRSVWKRTGGGPQGPFVFHQDKISNSAAALGVTLLDAPDGHRTVYSDAAMQQKMTFVASPPAGTGAGQNITTGWGLTLSGTVTNSVGSTWSPGDVLTIPITQLKNSLAAGDSDQLQFISDAGSVSVQIEGWPIPLIEGYHYAVTAVTGPTDDLVITLDAVNFPAAIVDVRLYINFHVQWGPGRGISRRPDQVHNVSYLSASSDIMTRQKGVPADNTTLGTAWTSLWSKYRNEVFHNLLPVTAESYVDLGSKTLILTPYRRIEMPTNIYALDGSYVNANYDEVVTSGTAGATADTNVFTDATKNFTTLLVAQGDILVIPSGDAAGEYVIDTVGTTTVTVEGANTILASAAGITYSIVKAQGLMPLNDISGGAKWTTTDPLNLFDGSQSTDAANKNLYHAPPRHMLPGWGEVRVPIIHTDSGLFDEGINYFIHTTKGTKVAPGNNQELNYLSYDGTTLTAKFSTLNLNTSLAATYNAAFSYSGDNYAGIRKYTDTRNLGRAGLELPPFYGIARLFGVYNAVDYVSGTNPGSPYDQAQEAQTGTNNLLRQDFDGPTFWVEIDEDGDSTFILNAECIDLSKSETAIADFASGEFVVEATIFGFDRNSFNLDYPARLVLCRERAPNQYNTGSRGSNLPKFFTISTGAANAPAVMNTPDLLVPGPAQAADEIAVNYSRTPYQGDAWGSQTSQQDIIYKQGPLLTSTLYQLLSTELDEENLTRPNQKGLEVLASTGFVTTLGTGRLSGDLPAGIFDFRNVGYEDWSGGLPTSGADPRPPLAVSALGTDAADIGTSYHGCTERLPLGARFLDKDFRGDFIGGNASTPIAAPFMFTEGYAPGILSSSIAVSTTFEQTGVQVGTSTLSSGQPGEVVVHVDGEQGNYGLLTNFRVNRGGSGFTAFAPRPGGEFAATFQTTGKDNTYSSVLVGRAYLVRNTVTNIGSTEVSAGGELMLLITTTAVPLNPAAGSQLKVFVGTNGTGEGYSAIDLYRITSHPMEVDNVRFDVDPSAITLAKKSTISF